MPSKKILSGLKPGLASLTCTGTFHGGKVTAVETPAGVQKTNLELLAALNEERRKLYPEDSRLDARIQHYELAARMQLAAERTLDLSKETESTRKLYAIDEKERSTVR